MRRPTGKSHTLHPSGISSRAALPKFPDIRVHRQSTPSSRWEQTFGFRKTLLRQTGCQPRFPAELAGSSRRLLGPRTQHCQPASKAPVRTRHGKNYFRLPIFKAVVRAPCPSVSPYWKLQRASPDLPPAQQQRKSRMSPGLHSGHGEPGKRLSEWLVDGWSMGGCKNSQRG